VYWVPVVIYVEAVVQDSLVTPFIVFPFTENPSTFEEPDSENKLHAILEKTRALQDTIKNVAGDDLDNSLDDLESPGHSVEDLSDVMSEKDGTPDHGEVMDQEIYGRFYRVCGRIVDLW
jgi:hypothetical protein